MIVDVNKSKLLLWHTVEGAGVVCILQDRGPDALQSRREKA